MFNLGDGDKKKLKENMEEIKKLINQGDKNSKSSQNPSPQAELNQGTNQLNQSADNQLKNQKENSLQKNPKEIQSESGKQDNQNSFLQESSKQQGNPSFQNNNQSNDNSFSQDNQSPNQNNLSGSQVSNQSQNLSNQVQKNQNQPDKQFQNGKATSEDETSPSNQPADFTTNTGLSEEEKQKETAFLSVERFESMEERIREMEELTKELMNQVNELESGANEDEKTSTEAGELLEQFTKTRSEVEDIVLSHED